MGNASSSMAAVMTTARSMSVNTTPIYRQFRDTATKE
jgi:hypothetical protein